MKPDGYRQYNTAYIEIPKKNGKQLALDTPIPTTDGWKEMGTLKIGDRVFDETGKPCRVVAVSEIDDTEQAYRITFRDRNYIIAGERHQWQVDIKRNNKFNRTITTTGEMFRGQNPERSMWRIPIANYLNLVEKELPIDPYVFGYWLGNGHSTKPELTVRRCDVEDIKALIPYEITGHRQQEGESDIIVVPKLKKILVSHFTKKRIPTEYLRASMEQRFSLLQGLTDSDGCISKIKGQSIFCTILPKLAEDVSELLWSLGIKNATTTTPSTRNGKPTGETCYVIRFTAFSDMEISKLDRKAENQINRKQGSRSHFHYIAKIEAMQEKVKMRCIQVDSPSRLYLAGKSMVPTHNSEIAAAVALLLTCGDFEHGGEIYGCASDRQQASIVFDVAVNMVDQCPPLKKRIKPILSQKRLVYKPLNSFYQVLSAEAYTKHGLNVHGCIFDEIHAQPTRDLFDVMTKGAGDARMQPLFWIITTAGDDPDRTSIGWEVHQKAKDILDGKIRLPNWYPVIYGLGEDDDWTSEGNWLKSNPSIGHTIRIETVRAWFNEAQQSAADERTFRQLRLNQWVKTKAGKWISLDIWDNNSGVVIAERLKGRKCYAGLDLSSKIDITAFVLIFPPIEEDPFYYILPYFWIPEDNMKARVKKDGVPYDKWVRQGFLKTTPGNVIDYKFIQKAIIDLRDDFQIQEVGYDPWNALQTAIELEDAGLVTAEVRQGYKTMSPAMKELQAFLLAEKMRHGGNPVLRWMFGNLEVKQDENDNIRPVKGRDQTKRIDGVVAIINAMARVILQEDHISVYEKNDLVVI